jgi:cytochrome c biogenesis factor
MPLPLRTKAMLIALAATLYVLGVAVFELHSMLVNTSLPVWAALLLILPLACWLPVIWFWRWLIADNKEAQLRWFTVPVVLFALFLSSSLAHRGADHFFLVYLYGSSRVQSENLHIVHAGKNEPWPVMSGDRQVALIRDYQVWTNIREAIGGLVFFTTIFVIYPFLPRRRSGPLRIWIRY